MSNDPTIYDELKNLGVSSKVPNWFVSLNAIKEQFAEINKKNIVILKHHALILIFSYLASKIRAEIINDFHKIVGEKEGGKDELIKSIKKILRRRDYGDGSLKTFKNGFDIIMNDLMHQTDKLFDNTPKKTEKYFLDSFNGKTEKLYIKELISCFIRPEGMLAPEFAAAISGLMKLLLKGRKMLLDEDDFLEGEALYGNNYKRYLANRIHKIAGLSEPSFFES